MPRVMRLIASLLLLPVLAACTSTSTVPAGSLQALHTAGGDGTILADDEGSDVRIDANSQLRFQRKDGSWTTWHRAGKLYANREGVFIPHRASFSEIDQVVVNGASEADVTTLRTVASNLDHLESGEQGTVILSGAVGPWIGRFIATTGVTFSGVWSFRARTGEWFSGFAGSTLPRLANEGIVGHDGLKFADMTSTEVKNINGGQTVVATAAITVVAIGIVALVAAAPKSKAPPDPTPPTIIHHTPPSHVVFIYHPGSSPPPPSPVSVPKSEDEALWKPGFEPPAADGSRRLFDEPARRRAATRFGASFDLGTALGHAGGASFGIVPMLRFSNVFEIGAGLRFLGHEVPGGTTMHSTFLARIGVHGELDAHRRFAVPLSIDVGAGSSVDLHARLNLGLRVRVAGPVWLGIHPFNPTYTRFDSSVGPTARLWTFPTMFETSFAF